MKQIVLMILMCVPCWLFGQTVVADASQVVGQVSPLIYGSGAEDVNHEIYGGLYDQRIFGEGFEEMPVMNVKDFTAYDSRWSVTDDYVQLAAASHGKLISKNAHLRKGSVEVEVRLDGATAIAGLILEVSSPSAGMDAFNGYEISLDADDAIFVFGKHQNNWQSITNVPVTLAAQNGWNKLRVDVDEAKFTCYVNDTKVFEYTDASSPLSGDLVGVRSVNGSASFRHLKVDGTEYPFVGEAGDVTNFKQYDNIWTLDNGVLNVTTTRHGKIIYDNALLGKGSIEVEVRMEGGSPIAGFIFDVSNPGTGADAFNGYEVSLNGNSRTFVFGKHEHNWTSITNQALTFTPTEWNKMRVDFDGKTAQCYINGTLVFEYEDKTATPLMQGLVGLRSYGGSASFRNFTIDGQKVPLVLVPIGLSNMWDAIGETATYTHDSKNPFTGRYAQGISGKKGDGAANRGLNKWGISVVKDSVLHNTLYLHGSVSEIQVALQSADGSKEYARSKVEGIGDEWKCFTTDLVPNATDPNARYVLELGEEGTVWADQVLLASDSYPFRSDLTQAFKDERLTFLRYGGCMINAAGYLTKNMIGNRLERQPYDGFWYLNSTNGFAIPEFVEFARLIGTEPAFSINVEDNPEDVIRMLDEIKQWRPRIIQIGNEEMIGTKELSAYQHYVERFLTLYNAIHPVYPDIEFAIAAWWRSGEKATMEYVFRALDGKASYWDYHPFTETPEQAKNTESVITQMQKYFLSWNPETTMRCVIFEENGYTHDMARALAHATMLCIVRRTNGFVPMDSPANALQPYMQNDNGWDQGQIFFDTEKTWMQPPYYAQQMAATYHQPLLVSARISGNNFDASVTKNEAGDTLVIHAVNYSNTNRNLLLSLKGFDEVKEVKAISLSGVQNGRNTPENPTQFAPVEEQLAPGNRLPLKPYSYTVFVLTTKGADGIAKVTAQEADTTLVYDISGRKASRDATGLLIMNNRVVRVR